MFEAKQIQFINLLNVFVLNDILKNGFIYLRLCWIFIAVQAFLWLQRAGGGGLVTQSCPILWDPMSCSPPGSSVHKIFQARILELVAISFHIAAL